MWEKIKKYRRIIYLLLIVNTFIIPIIIHFLFKIRVENYWIIAEWSAGEFLDYYGSLLTFLSTVLLSLLALWQNNEMKLENEEHRMYLENLELRKNLPCYMAQKTIAEKENKNLEFDLINISENFAYGIEIYDFKMYEDLEIVWKNSNIKKFAVVKPNESVYIQLDNPAISENTSIEFKMISYDKYFIRHFYEGKIKLFQNQIIIVVNENERGNGYE